MDARGKPGYLWIGRVLASPGSASMQHEPFVEQFRLLSRAEQIELLHTLWEELVDDLDAAPLSDAQRALLDQRLADLDEGRTELHDWQDVRDRLLDDR